MKEEDIKHTIEILSEELKKTNDGVVKCDSMIKSLSSERERMISNYTRLSGKIEAFTEILDSITGDKSNPDTKQQKTNNK